LWSKPVVTKQNFLHISYDSYFLLKTPYSLKGASQKLTSLCSTEIEVDFCEVLHTVSSVRCQETGEEKYEEKTRWDVVMFSVGQAAKSK